MRRIYAILLAILTLSLINSQTTATTIETYREPAYMSRSTDYSVKVNGIPVEVISDLNGYDYCRFSMWGGVATIEVTVAGVASISNYSISPKKLSIAGSVNANKLTYSITKDGPTIVWVSGKEPKLVVVADPQITDAPAQAGPGVYNVVTGFGADTTGNAWATSAIQSAIDSASAWRGAGPGTVIIPPGKFKTGNIHIKSNVSLYLQGGAALWFSGQKADYTTNWTDKGTGTRWINVDSGSINVKISGRGTIDGNALGANSFAANLLVLDGDSNVVIDGIILRNGGKWGTMVGRSAQVIFNNAKFFQNMSGVGEDDGIDIIESNDVIVKNSIACSFDDPFSVKSYSGMTRTGYIGFKGVRKTASHDITFDSCIAWTGCHAFKIGQGVALETYNVHFKNGVVYDCAHAVSIHHKAYTQSLHDCTWDNIDIEKVSQDNLGKSWAFMEIDSTSGGPGPISNITISNCLIRSVGGLCTFTGYDYARQIDGVTFDNITFAGADRPAKNLSELWIKPNNYCKNLRVLPQNYTTRREAEYWNAASSSVGTGHYEDGTTISVAGGTYAMYRNIDFANGNITSIDLRLSSVHNNGRIELRADSTAGTVLGSVTVPNLKSWSTFATLNVPITRLTGLHNLYLLFYEGDGHTVCLLNWFDTRTPRSALEQNNAVNRTLENGVKIGTDNDTAVLTNLFDGAWVEYADLDFGTGANSIDFRYSASAPGIVEIHTDHQDGPTIGTFNYNSTNGAYTTATVALNSQISDSQMVYFCFKQGTAVMQLNWFKFSLIPVRIVDRSAAATKPITPAFSHCWAGHGSVIRLPQGTRGVIVYDIRGKKIWEFSGSAASRVEQVMLPKGLAHQAMQIQYVK